MTAALGARISDNIVAGAYQSVAFARTPRLKPLKAYQTKTTPKKDGNEQARMLEALGITATEIEEARTEAARLRGGWPRRNDFDRALQNGFNP